MVWDFFLVFSPDIEGDGKRCSMLCRSLWNICMVGAGAGHRIMSRRIEQSAVDVIRAIRVEGSQNAKMIYYIISIDIQIYNYIYIQRTFSIVVR